MVAGNSTHSNGGGPPAGRSPSAPPSESTTQPTDPRLDLLRSWLAAVDDNDPRSAIAVARELKRLGVSIVPVTPKNAGGER